MNRSRSDDEVAWPSSWQYSGSIPLTKDLSLLEPALRVGQLEAAEHGYRQGGPDSILVDEVMFFADSQGFLSLAEAKAAGVRFVPTHARFVMTWAGRSGSSLRPTPDSGWLRPSSASLSAGRD